ncbi:MAG: transposase [Phycisphaerae bacterium]
MGGVIYHVTNRGNGRMKIFRKPGDYLSFVELLIAGKQRVPMDVFGFCLMPNHWHLVLRPRGGDDLAAYLSWVSNTHVKRFRVDYPQTSGHLYQGRYKSFPVESSRYLVGLLRYVEANPLRAELVKHAEDWPWSSLGGDKRLVAELLSPWPVDRPRNWRALVNRPMDKPERERLLTSFKRGCPLGEDHWVARMAARMGLEHTLNPLGRPKKQGTR